MMAIRALARSHSSSFSTALSVMFLVATSLALGRGLADGHLEFRPLAAVAVLVLLIVFGLVYPERMLLALVVWFVSLGLLRRLFLVWSPPGRLDYLLVVGAIALATLAAEAGARGAFRHPTFLSKMVIFFSVLAVFGAL